MAVVAWVGVSDGQSPPVSYTGTGNPNNSNFAPAAGGGGVAPKDYPFTDPVFQQFTVQQYLTVTGVNAAQTYAVEAPPEEENDDTEVMTMDEKSSPSEPKLRPVRKKSDKKDDK